MRVADWITLAGGRRRSTPTPIQDTPYVPTILYPTQPDGVSNSLLSVTPVNRQLTVGQSVALSDLFPASFWVDNDGAPDIVRFAVQDRSAGGGYLTHMWRPVAPNQVHEMPISDLVNWRFVAGSGAATDRSVSNIIQSDGDFSPRLTTGAVVTTVCANGRQSGEPDADRGAGNRGRTSGLLISENGVGGRKVTAPSSHHPAQGQPGRGHRCRVADRGIGDNPADRRDFPAMSGTVTLYDGRGDRTSASADARTQVDELNESFRIGVARDLGQRRVR